MFGSLVFLDGKKLFNMKKILSPLGFSQNFIFGMNAFVFGSPILFVIHNIFINEIPYYFEKYVFNDWSFLPSLTLLVLLDTITGGLGAYLTPIKSADGKVIGTEFSGIKLYKKLANKIFGITIYVVSIGILENTIIHGEANVLADIVDSGFYSVMMAFELASVLRNTYKIYPFEVIKLALEKLEVFYDKKNNKVNTNRDEADK